MSLDDLKARVKELPISSVIGRYIAVTRKGTQQLAVCPFHDDHSPSLNINDHRGMFFCFVDQIGGDAIKFVMLYKRLEFVDALKDICEVMGWNFEEYQDRQRQVSPNEEMGKKLMTKSSQLFQKYAWQTQNETFLNFLKNRSVSEEAAKTFQLGFAPTRNVLLEYLTSIPNEKEREFALKVAFELTLLKEKNGARYDTFRERIMFPICDHSGQVIGYTSRATKDEQLPKYLNSSDSFLFNKRQLLYGFHLAKNAIREKDAVIIVEGNMDLIALHAKGFTHSVAIMGVALGDSSLKRLKSMTENVYLCLDNDQGGQNASKRINEQWMYEGVTPRYIDLTPHKDPDEFLIHLGAVEFQKRIENAKPYIDVLLENLIPTPIPELPEKQLKVLQMAYPILAPMGEKLEAMERLTTLARKLGLKSESSVIANDYRHFLKHKQTIRPVTTENQTVVEEEKAQPVVPQSEPVVVQKWDQKLTKVESTFLQQIVQHPELAMNDSIGELLDFVDNSEVKRFVLRLRDLLFEIDLSEYAAVVDNLLNAQEFGIDLVTHAGAGLYNFRPTELNEKVITTMIDDLKFRLQEEQLKLKRKVLEEKHKKLETLKEQQELLIELASIDKELAQLKGSRKKGPR
ncbi:MAG: hypothetical protein OHK0056_17610 [Bacteriovoracaceae bacterium]